MGAPNWNPASPGRVGVQHPDAGVAQFSVDSSAHVFELHYEAQASRTIDAFDVYAGTGAQAPLASGSYNGLPKAVMLELVPRGSEARGTVTQHDFQVSTITGGVGMFNEDLTTPITASRLAASNDGLFLAASKLGAAFNCNFASGAYPLDRHVVGVKVQMRINLSTELIRIDPGGYTDSPWNYTIPWWTPGAQPVQVLWGETFVEGLSGTEWDWWTPQRIREFATTRGVRIRCAAGPGYWRMDRLYLSVYSIPERRRAVGLASPTDSFEHVRFPVQVPMATGAPAITAGEDLSLLIRRVQDGSTLPISDATMPVRYLRGRSDDGNWSRHNHPGGARVDGIPSIRTIDGTTVVEDSQPYFLQRGALVYGSEVVDQTLNMPGGATIYGQAYVHCGWITSHGRPLGSIRAELLLDGVRVFAPVELTPAQVAALPTTAVTSAVDDIGVAYKRATFRFAESSVLAADQYVLRISSPDSSEERPWYVGALIADTDAAGAAALQTFQASTGFADGLWPSSGTTRELTQTNVWSSDAQMQLVEVPGPVTGVGTAVGSLTAHHLELCEAGVECSGCADDTMPYIQLTWSAAPSGTPDVSGYEVDRQDDRLPNLWERVASVGGRTSTVWNDHEARIGVPTRYRLRVMREDGVTGDWSVPIQETIPTGQVALAFSSNAATGMGCVYPEIWDGDVERTWTFRDADSVEEVMIFGRNMPVAFRRLERSGEAFTRTLLLDAMCTVAPPSLAVFDPLRALALAPIPYVCVRDGEGNRWYSRLLVPNGTNMRSRIGHELWVAEVGIGEVQAVASVHDTTVDQVEEAASL